MKLTVSTIKVLFWISIALLIISLFLAILFQFYCGNGIISWFISIATGVFASSFVVLLSEYIRYIHQKRDAEYHYFHHLSLAYSNLISIKNEIGIKMVSIGKSVQSSFIRSQIEVIRKSIDELFGTEYYTLCKSGRMRCAIDTFKIENIPTLQQFYSLAYSLDISIIEDKMLINKQKLDLLKNQQKDADIKDYVTIESPQTSLTLAKIQACIDDTISIVDSMLMEMEQFKPKWHKWSQLKKIIENNIINKNS